MYSRFHLLLIVTENGATKEESTLDRQRYTSTGEITLFIVCFADAGHQNSARMTAVGENEEVGTISKICVGLYSRLLQGFGHNERTSPRKVAGLQTRQVVSSQDSRRLCSQVEGRFLIVCRICHVPGTIHRNNHQQRD